MNFDNSDDYNVDEKNLKNSIALSPKSLQHILSWASLFDPAMSIPIRQGDLFPSLEPPSPKLANQCNSVKYKDGWFF